jgi:hypothetical protein
MNLERGGVVECGTAGKSQPFRTGGWCRQFAGKAIHVPGGWMEMLADGSFLGHPSIGNNPVKTYFSGTFPGYPANRSIFLKALARLVRENELGGRAAACQKRRGLTTAPTRPGAACRLVRA